MRAELDDLSSHIESLIGQLQRCADRLPPEGKAVAQPAETVEPALQEQPPPGADYWLAPVEHELEHRDETGCETYRIRQSSGRQIRCVYYAPPG
jgi:hypothetical protein